jgi:ABC-type branched-subunit amino acid transport system permease subunit
VLDWVLFISGMVLMVVGNTIIFTVTITNSITTTTTTTITITIIIIITITITTPSPSLGLYCVRPAPEVVTPVSPLDKVTTPRTFWVIFFPILYLI